MHTMKYQSPQGRDNIAESELISGLSRFALDYISTQYKGAKMHAPIAYPLTLRLFLQQLCQRLESTCFEAFR
jgi:hypothetical protein